MSTSSPTITEAKIIGWVGAPYAGRGRSYYNGGHVIDIRWRGAALTGRVQGSEPEPYRVRIAFDGRAMDGDCSCPVGFNCKHVAAVLYAQMSAPARTRQSAPLEKQLAGLEKPALIQLIAGLVEEAPELEDVVEAELAAARSLPRDADALQDQVQALLAADDARAARRLARAMEQWVAEARLRLKAGAPGEAFSLLRAIFGGLLAADVVETDPGLTPAAQALLDCWRALPEADPARGEALRLLYEVVVWDLRTGADPLAARIGKGLVKYAGRAEREQVREWIALAERQPPAARPARRKAAWEPYDDDGDDYDDDEYDEDDDYGDEDGGVGDWALKRLEKLSRGLAAPAARKKAGRTQAKAGTRRGRGVRSS